jgi:hypothetical protein
VAAGEAGAARHRLGHVGRPLAGELGHGPDGDDEVERAKTLGIVEGVEAVGDGDLEAFSLEHPSEHVGDEVGLVARPAAPGDEGLHPLSSRLNGGKVAGGRGAVNHAGE